MRKRRAFVALALFVVVGVGTFAPLCDPPALETGAYVQDVTPSGGLVVYESGTLRRLGLVVRDGEKVVFEAAAPAEAKRRHELRATGLAANVRHAFELRDEDGDVVDRGSFKTSSDRDTDAVRFAIAGDSGGQPWWLFMQETPLYRLIGAETWWPGASEPRAVAALLREADPDLWLHCGDVVYPRGELRHYVTGFFHPFRDVLRRAPVYPVLGNHDLMTDGGAAFFGVFVLPESGAGERCFTLRHGPVRVIGLDLEGVASNDLPSVQYLKRVASASSEPWLIVYSHYPARSVYRSIPRPDLTGFYVPLCRELGIDVVVSGHDHNYQRYGEPGETMEIVSGGGGKSLYPILYRPQGLTFAASEFHVCVVEVNGAKLTWTARSIDGRVIDRFEIDKGKSVREGTVRGGAERVARVRALVE